MRLALIIILLSLLPRSYAEYYTLGQIDEELEKYQDWLDLLVKIEKIPWSHSYREITGLRFSLKSNWNKNLPKILVIGGVHGSLTAAAEVLSFISSFRLSFKISDDYNNLINNFQIEIFPVINRELYNQFKTMNDEKNIKIKHPKYKKDCDPDSSFSDEKCSNTSIVKIIKEAKLNNTIIINIQGSESSYDDDTKIIDPVDKYFYKSILKSLPKKRNGSLVNYILDSSSKYNKTYILQYKYKSVKSLNNQNTGELFINEFEKIFKNLNDKLSHPNIKFKFLKETEDSSLLDLKFTVTNTYPFDIKANLTIMIKMNENDLYNHFRLDSIEARETKIYDKNKNSKLIKETINSWNDTEPVQKNGIGMLFFRIRIYNTLLNALSYRDYQIRLSRNKTYQNKVITYLEMSDDGGFPFQYSSDYNSDGILPQMEPEPPKNSSILLLTMLISLAILLIDTIIGKCREYSSNSI